MSANLVRGWEVVIGLEVHAQISTKSKLFSSSSTEYGSDPNTQVSFYDAGMPGMLPVLNSEAIDLAIKSGFGIKGTINKVSVFDRKNYFYPDLPSGYQISQLYQPIVTDGVITIDLPDGLTKDIRVERIHIEQDAGKSIHDLSATKSYIDLNRSGIPLMEIVSAPDMRSPSEAMAYVKKLRMILKYLGTSDCNMERGNLRVDANISIRKPGDPFGNRAEIKNINSIKFLGQALEYEIERQILAIESGEVIVQETRLFDSSKCETRSMRSKEDAADYRYFHDPDLKPVVLTDERIQKIKDSCVELPDEKRQRFVDEYGLNISDASILTDDLETANIFEEAVGSSKFKIDGSAKLIANWMIGELFGYLNKQNKTINDLEFPINYIAELVDLIMDQTISGKIAKTIFAEITETNKSPNALVKEMGLEQIQDDGVIRTAAKKVLDGNMDKVEQYKSGKDKLFGFFVGNVMKDLQGKANPEMVNNILKELLE